MLKVPQIILNVRKRAEKMANDMGVDNFELTPEDMRLLLAVRSYPYGSLTISVHEGKPTSILRVEEKISLTKGIFFE